MAGGRLPRGTGPAAAAPRLGNEQHLARGAAGLQCGVGRRGLGADETVRFYAVPSGGADLLDDATRAVIVAETDRLRAEYF